MMPIKIYKLNFLFTFHVISIVASREVYSHGWSSMESHEDTVSAMEVNKVLNDLKERERLSLSVDQVEIEWPHEVPTCLYEEEIYNPISKNCSRPEKQGDCADNMIFLPVPNTKNLGACACKNSNCWGRPDILADDNQCYGIGTQAPCDVDETVVPIGKFQAECSLDVCFYRTPVRAINFSQGSKEQPLRFPVFNFTYEGNCYTTESQAFCETGQVTRFVFPYKIPVCVHGDEDKCVEEPPVRVSEFATLRKCSTGERPNPITRLCEKITVQDLK